MDGVIAGVPFVFQPFNLKRCYGEESKLVSGRLLSFTWFLDIDSKSNEILSCFNESNIDLVPDNVR